MAMRVHSANFTVSTSGKGTYEITDQVAAAVKASGVRVGTVTVFVRHTSCSLIIMENADPSARRDLGEIFRETRAGGDAVFRTHRGRRRRQHLAYSLCPDPLE